MREILFRGMRCNNCEWVYGDLLHDGIDYRMAIRETGTREVIAVDPVTVGQYTGLTDVNGKKIFEGDILRDIGSYLAHKHYFELGMRGEENYERYRDVGKRALVEFCCEEVGSCGCCYAAFEGSGFIAFDVKIDSCEVIGNIHDNPGMLKKGAKNG